MIHGLWNTSSIFSSITPKLDNIGIEYFAPTLEHSYGMTSILDLTNKLNELILEKYGLEKEIDILGFSMGGIIGRHWLQKFNGYKRTRRLISIGSPHKGTLMAQLIPKYPFRGISEMKINSNFLRELANNDFLLDDIECINFLYLLGYDGFSWLVDKFKIWEKNISKSCLLYTSDAADEE